MLKEGKYDVPDSVIKALRSFKNGTICLIFQATEKIIPGLFIEYAGKNGAKAVARSANAARTGIRVRELKNIFRVSPGVELISGKFKFGSEIEYTVAQHGTLENNKKVTGSIDKINNTRFLLTTTFSF